MSARGRDHCRQCLFIMSTISNSVGAHPHRGVTHFQDQHQTPVLQDRANFANTGWTVCLYCAHTRERDAGRRPCQVTSHKCLVAFRDYLRACEFQHQQLCLSQSLVFYEFIVITSMSTEGHCRQTTLCILNTYLHYLCWWVSQCLTLSYTQ